MSVIMLLAAVVLGSFVGILILSPGRPRPFLGPDGRALPGSISEKGTVTVNGVTLGYVIKGESVRNPVLLYLHGGMPDYFLTGRYPTGLDRIFTVVWLDQRGAGLSYAARAKGASVGIDDLISDTIGVTDYLRRRFSQDKIYLMAHSGGTYLGIKVIERRPDLYKAYIGVSQIAYQKLSEKMAYEYIVGHYAKDPGKKGIYKKLLSDPVVLEKPLPPYYLRIRDYAMHDLGVGTMRNMKGVISGVFIPSLLFKEYSLADKINLWRGKAHSGISVMWDEMSGHDLSKESVAFKIPVYFLHGVHDYTCSYDLARRYFDIINAPRKGFYSFRESAHSPIFEEPAECVRAIRENILDEAKRER